MWSLDLSPTEGRLEPRRSRRPSRSDPTRLPDHPVAYHQLLRGPRWRWWLSLVSLAVLIGLLIVLFVVVLSGFEGPRRAAAGPLGRHDRRRHERALRARARPDAGGTGPGRSRSRRHRPPGPPTLGRLGARWAAVALAGRCSLVVAPVWVVYLGLGLFLDPVGPGRPEHWVLLLVMALLVTPFQAAGEELLFRGWLVQNVGGCFARPSPGWW